ncbi:MAG: DUF4351 domain-containing protein [Anaerolineales bacterium]|nr:DUF4351 domain-containing protein [Anaerolineales bacterium]
MNFLQYRFGPLDATLTARVNCLDLDQLEALTTTLFTARNLADIMPLIERAVRCKHTNNLAVGVVVGITDALPFSWAAPRRDSQFRLPASSPAPPALTHSRHRPMTWRVEPGTLFDLSHAQPAHRALYVR